jgi:hypothetical protein
MPRWRQSAVGPVWRHSLGPWLRAPRLGSWRERDGEAEGVFLPLLTGRRGVIRWPLAVTCNAMRRRRLGHRDGSGAEPPGRLRPRPASRGAHQLRSRRCAIPPGVDTHGGGLGGGVRGSTLTRGSLGGRVSRGCATRHLLPWPWGRNRAATPCASAQLQHLAGHCSKQGLAVLD